MELDRRVNAVREDLIDISLKDHAGTRRVVEPGLAQISEGVVPVRSEPRFDKSFDTHALYGETVKLFDQSEGWSWIQLLRDNYVGYVPSQYISDQVEEASLRVSVLQTFVYPAPNIKTPPLATLPMNARVKSVEQRDQFIKISDGGYIYASHLVSINDYAGNFVEIAQKFVGTPYLWGGCSSHGIDCSGLIQMALLAAGHECPRDSDMQETQLGETVATDADSLTFQSGDLIFWKGHVGVMIDEHQLLHANGYHMNTVIEPVHEAISRIAASYGQVTSVKRL